MFFRDGGDGVGSRFCRHGSRYELDFTGVAEKIRIVYSNVAPLPSCRQCRQRFDEKAFGMGSAFFGANDMLRFVRARRVDTVQKFTYFFRCIAEYNGNDDDIRIGLRGGGEGLHIFCAWP